MAERQRQLNLFIENLKESHPKSRKAYLSKVFYKTHKKFLKVYNPYSTFSGVFESGQYDCLTATILYGIVLDALQLPYQIVETNYHIYIKVMDGEATYLFETTDPSRGFVHQPKLVAQLLSLYDSNLPLDENGNPVENDENLHSFDFDIHNTVDLEQLPGLLYYNKAIVDFNSGHLLKALRNIEKANLFYDSKRLLEFKSICLQTIKDKGIHTANNTLVAN